MQLDFDCETDVTRPISSRTAVDRGHALITRRVWVVMGVGAAVGLGFMFAGDTGAIELTLGLAIGLGILLASPLLARIWWSYAVPRWRHWALSRGANPVELQLLTQHKMLVWPRGHFFERTEFRFRPPA
ncbi:MAG: hypothetical protein H0W15_10760 [Gemmatimonadales bacterium]|nr:hypothetical protein [Gemmatimonadales bacterium]